MNTIQLTEDRAVERYQYLLRTAAPEQIEQAHAEAFERLPPEQRRLVLECLNKEFPPRERTTHDDPRSLALMATRYELHQPGALERAFGNADPDGMGADLGRFVAGSFLSTIAGAVVGSAVADAIFGKEGYGQEYVDGSRAPTGGQNAHAAVAGGNLHDDFGSVYFGGDF